MAVRVDFQASQMIFFELVTNHIVRFHARDAGRMSATAALSLCCVAKSGRRHELSSWGWRALRACEAELHRWAAARAGDAETTLSVIGRYVRSNTEIRAGPVEQRVRELIFRFNVNAHVLQTLRTSHPMLRGQIDAELVRSQVWYRDVADDASTTTDEAMSIDGEQ
jgi:hypothetical protein